MKGSPSSTGKRPAPERGQRWVVPALLAVAAICAAVIAVLAVRYLSAPQSQRPAVDANPVLDGRRPLDRAALADLALRRARLGARWLAADGRADGSFFYWYYPDRNAVEVREYNEVRHGGTTYSMFQADGTSPDGRVRAAAERAAVYIDRMSPPAPDRSGRAFVYAGRTKLGGQALALVGLLERRRVTRDRRYDALIGEMARFMRSLERRDEPGRYFNSYLPAGNRRLPTPDSDFYPGEALLALVRLEQHFPGKGYRAAAIRAGDHLARLEEAREAAGAPVLENHWLALAFAELYRLKGDRRYRDVVYRQADSMAAHQYTARDRRPDLIGAPTNRQPVNYTSSATKAEALVAAWALARFARDRRAEARYSDAALRNVQFQMRVQYTPERSRGFPRPERVVGAWPQDARVPGVRMDFVQHNVSALLTAWQMVERGDVALQAGGRP